MDYHHQPPYGERLDGKSLHFRLCIENSVRALRKLDSWSAYMITSYEETERYFWKESRQEPKDLQWNAKDVLLSIPRSKAAEKEEISGNLDRT